MLITVASELVTPILHSNQFSSLRTEYPKNVCVYVDCVIKPFFPAELRTKYKNHKPVPEALQDFSCHSPPLTTLTTLAMYSF